VSGGVHNRRQRLDQSRVFAAKRRHWPRNTTRLTAHTFAITATLAEEEEARGGAAAGGAGTPGVPIFRASRVMTETSRPLMAP
jgi:hypothetical protein